MTETTTIEVRTDQAEQLQEIQRENGNYKTAIDRLLEAWESESEAVDPNDLAGWIVDQISADETEQSDPLEDQQIMDVKVTSNAADGATIDVNGTTLKIFQHDPHTRMIAEIYIEDEPVPIGTINTASGETVTLGGVEEMLAQRVEQIKEMPVEEIPEELEYLAYRLNPAGREKPDSDTDKEGGDE